VLGYILNRSSKETSLAAETNREVLFGLTGVPCLAELPFFETGVPQKILPPDVVEKEFDVRLLAPALMQK
jgi:hypothetical protein